MTRCLGCGIELQNSDINKLGYTKKMDSNYCLRCFRIKNYNEYKLVDKSNSDYIDILKSIDKKDLVVLVVDLFNTGNLNDLLKYINSNILLVLTKRDILPLSVYDKRIEEYFDNKQVIDKVIISSKNNYNYDLLYNKIKKYRTDNVYVVGYTNSGKSSMINKLIYNYTNDESNITVSNLPSTTLNKIEILFEDFKLIDTPGILDEGNIINYIDKELLNKITPKCEIKPKIYQVKNKESIIVEDILRLDVENNNIVFYMANQLNYIRVHKDTEKLNNLKKHVLNVEDNSDIVIDGLGFIKIKYASSIVLYTLDNVKVYIRNSLI